MLVQVQSAALCSRRASHRVKLGILKGITAGDAFFLCAANLPTDASIDAIAISGDTSRTFTTIVHGTIAQPWLEEPCDHPVLSLSQQNQPVHASPRDIRRATAAYYGMVETVDNHYGQVLGELERVGENLDDWTLIYTSDYGEMLGEHGIWEKTRFYEGSVRVPLIVRWPRRFAGGPTVKQNVNLCDLFATICDLAGVPTPDGLDSRSLVPLLEGDSSDWMTRPSPSSTATMS